MTDTTDTTTTDNDTGDTAAAADPAATDSGITMEQAETLLARLEKLESRSDRRPASTRDQLQTRLAAAMSLQSDGAAGRREGRDVADSAADIARETRDELRRRDIMDAARSARFIDPTDAVTELMSKDGDPADLVAALAKVKTHWVARSTEIDLTDSTGAAVSDPGLAEFARSIAKGRNV